MHFDSISLSFPRLWAGLGAQYCRVRSYQSPKHYCALLLQCTTCTSASSCILEIVSPVYIVTGATLTWAVGRAEIALFWEWWDRWYFLRTFFSKLSHTVPRVDNGSKSPRFATTCSVVDQWPPSTQADGSPCIVEPPKVNHTSLGQYYVRDTDLVSKWFLFTNHYPPLLCKLSFQRRWHSRHLWIFLVILEVFLAPTSNKGSGCFLSL